jgi:cobyrinic acid a,c-diamide synthase
MNEALPGVKVPGCVPRDERLHIPSRHLGLLTAEENPLPEPFREHLAEVIERHGDVDGILNAGAELALPKARQAVPLPNPVRIAVARDAAFCFVYEDNLRLLREAGAEIVEFSPLRESCLPEGTAGIYLPGGYPELFADTLAANQGMKRAVRAAIEEAMPVYAECGGFIYLTRGVVDAKSEPGSLHGFVGVFPAAARMLPRRKALGYREVELTRDSAIAAKGMVARGHEFHYSEMGEMPAHVERAHKVRKNGIDLGPEGYCHKNCLASYIHLHFGSCPGVAAAFVDSCRKFNGRRKQQTS